MHTISIMAVAAAVVVSGFALRAAQAQFTGLKRTDLMQRDLSVPGREVVQSRVDFPAGVDAPKHNHPGEEIVYVIEGVLEYQLEGEPPATLKAGDVLFIPAGKFRAVKNVGPGNAAELGTYLGEKGKPLVTLFK